MGRVHGIHQLEKEAMRYYVLILALTLGVAACGDSAAGPDADRFCEILDELDAQNTEGLPPEEALPIIVEGRDKFEEGKEVAPEEIKADAETVANGAIQITDLLIAAGGDETKVDEAALTTVLGEVFTPEYEAATQSVNTWRQTACS